MSEGMRVDEAGEPKEGEKHECLEKLLLGLQRLPSFHEDERRLLGVRGMRHGEK